MDDTTRYFKDAPKLIYELLQDTLGDRYTYFLGSPVSIDQTAYPCVVIQTIQANNTLVGAATGQDRVSEIININILRLDSGNAATTGSVNTVLRDMYNLVQGRDPDTGFYMRGSILYALRTNLTIGNTVINNDIDINYDVSPTPDNRNVIEAIVTIATTERVTVPNRV